MLRVGWNRCPFCNREDIFVSRPKCLSEEIVILALLQPVRCHDCMRRFFRPLFASPPPNTVARGIEVKEMTGKETTSTHNRRAA